MQASSAETTEGKGSPGFFSQVFSELTAPYYEEDEQDFLSEDSDSENPTPEDQSGGDDPGDTTHKGDKPNSVNSAQTAEQEADSGRKSGNPTPQDQTGGRKPEETSNKEGDKPNFASPAFAKSVTENVNSARTAEKEVHQNIEKTSESENQLLEDQTEGDDLEDALQEGSKGKSNEPTGGGGESPAPMYM